ncbi:hypothetical protein [Marmoricola sp. OAE513]|uniref:hypothetical protein n=1 Tax=Marmoricola sp. OAE513 TaxID=2817894 RepID=UPI001D999830
MPSTLALLPRYASTEDPIADLRAAVGDAVAWLVEDGPVAAVAATPSAQKVADHLVAPAAHTVPGLLLVANGSATRTEKAPGHLDERAEAFDAAIGAALAAGDLEALGAIDLELAGELWAPDAVALVSLGRRLVSQGVRVTGVSVDYDDAPYGVQYWVVRWQCESS